MKTSFYNQVNKINYFPDAVLITGQPYSDTAELYVPSSGVSCSLPPLPDTRYGHTVENTGLLCGGYGIEVEDTCLQWSPDTGTWEELLTFDNIQLGRADHVSWTPGPDLGTYLMGGAKDGMSTTWIKPDGTHDTGFPLKYDTE